MILLLTGIFLGYVLGCVFERRRAMREVREARDRWHSVEAELHSEIDKLRRKLS